MTTNGNTRDSLGVEGPQTYPALDLDCECSPGLCSSWESLPVEVLRHLAREFLGSPRDVLFLAKVDMKTWNALKLEIFVADIISCRDISGISKKLKSFVPALHWLVVNDFADISLNVVDVVDYLWPDYLNLPEPNPQLPIHLATAHGHIVVIQKRFLSKTFSVQTPLYTHGVRNIVLSFQFLTFKDVLRYVAIAFFFHRVACIDALGIAIACGNYKLLNCFCGTILRLGSRDKIGPFCH
ncbi:hypothetical protein F5Y19DRAFT_478446 [Xylariaceae sp. FL1651]|nr:hypothetical protein F5Y19DRAFT_478446 [Xylariaceae sp. FL1651]